MPAARHQCYSLRLKLPSKHTSGSTHHDHLLGEHAPPFSRCPLFQGRITNGIFIVNSPPAGGADSITAFSSATGASPIGGTLPASFFVSLSDPGGNTFSNLALPTTPPDVGSFANNEWRLVFANGDRVVGSFSNLTAVPLPAAVFLLGAGLTALVGLGAGGLRYLR